MTDKVEERHCCISHEFFRTASTNPNKIAIIHASGGARICRELRQKVHEPGFDHKDEEAFFDDRRKSSSPLVYEGDECFTFSDILASVDSLSARIRHILDGGDDPNLIRPREQTMHSKILETSKIANVTGDHSSRFQNVDNSPQILGIYMVPSVEYVIAVLSVLRCGEAFMPLDPSWPKERILSIVSNSKVGLIIKGRSLLDTSNHLQLGNSDWIVDHSYCSVLYILMKGNLQDQFSQSHLVWPCESRNPRAFCYLMYTSGSTGKPKGVCGTEQGLLNRLLWMQELYPLHGGESLIFKTSISFIDHLQEFLSAILTGTPLFVPPFEELKGNPLYIVGFLKSYSISRLTAVPSLMRAILPALQSPYCLRLQRSLQVLVLSGEVLPLSLWDMLHKLLPATSILNLYGSTEVSGDCTYFDCKRLPMVLETEDLSSVPIGMPISNCDIVLAGEPNALNEGEIYVGGHCISIGYFLNPTITSLDYIKLPQDSVSNGPFKDSETRLYFRTGDFAKRLPSGDLVFLGRKDRTIKVNGQRVALEEIENILREHSNVVDAAVTSHKGLGEPVHLVAYIVLKIREGFCEVLGSSIRSWLVKKLPLAMIPNHYLYVDSLPMSSTGKINYAFLADSFFSRQVQNGISNTQHDHDILQVIKEAFCDALMVQKVADDDDFFMIGGNSIAAAQVAYKLGIDMRLLYIFSSASKLKNVLMDREGSYKDYFTRDADRVLNPKPLEGNMLWLFDLADPILYNSKSLGRPLSILSEKSNNAPVTPKYLEVDSNFYRNSGTMLSEFNYPSISNSNLSRACSFSRCNKVIYEGEYVVNDVCQACWSVEIPRDRKGNMRELWRVHLESCVDASPLVVFNDGHTYLFIGSHSHIFLCVNALSGLVKWEVKLEGRVECSATITSDFSQVVVGCYKGKIYFLDYMTGNISWVFQTGGEVKSQPVVDKCRNLIWCGSYDHNLYALDYINHCCVYKISCGGSVYGSPSIDMVQDILYVASTSGRVTALSIKALSFNTMWQYELGAPVFGSPSISFPSGNVICCLVDGHVIALSSSGSIVWRVLTGGPIFAGACISYVLPSQVLICSRNGSVYSFELEEGDLLWEYNIGEPITSSAYVDENMLLSDLPHPSDRLVCICGSSGSIHLLRINLIAMINRNQPAKDSVGPLVQEFAKMNLQGDIFSSPVMIGGRIFVGCRDDYVHCIGVEAEISAS